MATGESLRRDAVRNRGRILAAARLLFAERGLHVTMDEIAREAGVGVGTVYRRFPNRDALIATLFEERLQEYVANAEEAAAHPDPGEALETLLERTIEMQAVDRGLHELLVGDAEAHERLARTRNDLRPVIEDLLRRAHRSGALRPDVAITDLPVLGLMLREVVDFSHDVAPQLWRRYLAILLDGIRSTGRPLPQPALAQEQLEAAMSCHKPRRP